VQLRQAPVDRYHGRIGLCKLKAAGLPDFLSPVFLQKYFKIITSVLCTYKRISSLKSS
jgi:hypothetical protein